MDDSSLLKYNLQKPTPCLIKVRLKNVRLVLTFTSSLGGAGQPGPGDGASRGRRGEGSQGTH